jgi:hypothetical protein
MAAIPPPALSGSGSWVENYRFSSQPGITRLPVRVILTCVTSISFFLEMSRLTWKLFQVSFDALSA